MDHTRWLPTESLAKVFEDYTPSPDEIQTLWLRYIHELPVQQMDSPLMLGSVCRRWRSISTSTPTLWTTIPIGGAESSAEKENKKLDMWSSRSKQLPLTLVVTHLRNVPWIDSDIKTKISCLFQRCNHVDILSYGKVRPVQFIFDAICGNQIPMEVIFRFEHAALFPLEVWECPWVAQFSYSEPRFPGGYAGVGYFAPFHMPILRCPNRNMRKVFIQAHFVLLHRLSQWLSKLPSLEYAHIDIQDHSSHYDRDNYANHATESAHSLTRVQRPGYHAHLPFLRHLSLSIGVASESDIGSQKVELPALEVLEIQLGIEGLYGCLESPVLSRLAKLLLSGSTNSLHTVVLRDLKRTAVEDLITFLQFLPQVRKLNIAGNHRTPVDHAKTLFQVLTTNQQSGFPGGSSVNTGSECKAADRFDLCPRLESLTVGNMEWDDHVVGSAIAMIHSRWRPDDGSDDIEPSEKRLCKITIYEIDSRMESTKHKLQRLLEDPETVQACADGLRVDILVDILVSQI